MKTTPPNPRDLPDATTTESALLTILGAFSIGFTLGVVGLAALIVTLT